MIDASYERMRSGEGPAFAEAVTYAFADPGANLFGVVRLGVSGARRGSLLGVLFSGSQPVAQTAEGDLDVPQGADWADLPLPGARTTVEAPLERWTVRWEDGGVDLAFEAASAPAELAGPVVDAGGMSGYEQLCRVSGGARVDGREVTVDGVGQRGHAWGSPDWDRMELTRSLAVWLEQPGDGIVAGAVRPAGANAHADEALWAAVVEAGEPQPVADPRLSTTYDTEGRQRRAGLELWPSDEAAYAHRAGGEVLAGATLDLGALRLDLAFLRWHADGADGVGRYDIVRRAG